MRGLSQRCGGPVSGRALGVLGQAGLKGLSQLVFAESKVPLIISQGPSATLADLTAPTGAGRPEPTSRVHTVAKHSGHLLKAGAAPCRSYSSSEVTASKTCCISIGPGHPRIEIFPRP